MNMYAIILIISLAVMLYAILKLRRSNLTNGGEYYKEETNKTTNLKENK